MGSVDDIQTVLKPFENKEYIFITILELAESFKTMNWPARPDPTVTLFDGLFLGMHKR